MNDHGSSSESPGGDATRILQRMRAGDAHAAESLLPLVYAELRARAAAYFRGQPAQHTLQPTALVHEAYLKMVRAPGDGWNSRAHFCAVAATAMRQLLVDHARRRAVARQDRIQRGAQAPEVETAIDVLDLDEALVRLGEVEPDSVRIVELRFFGGLSLEETAEVLQRSLSSVKRDWRRARATLRMHLHSQDPS